MKLRKVLALTLAAAMTLSLTACGGSGEGGAEAPATETPAADDGAAAETPAADDGDEAAAPAASSGVTYASINLGEDYKDLTTTIKFIHHKTDREEDGTISDLIAKFNELYPNIMVETEGITDYQEDALLRLSAGDWGDVMFIPAVDKAELSTYFIPFGTVEEMSEYVNFADEWMYDNMCYGIGFMGNAQGILYNKKVFADAGITELPKTPDEFIAALQAIKDNTDAIPLYTNYAAGWTGTGAYALYKILYDAVEKGLIEDDYTTTDWEGCKPMINNGEIGCMVLGSWAIAQMKAAGDHPDDIGYMPFPITVGSKQYATAGPDYSYAINANASEENQAAAMVFVKWMVEESGWCEIEGGYPISKTAPTSFVFEGVEVVRNIPALEGEEDFLNEMNAESELSFNAGGDAKVQRIVEAAFTGVETFDDIMADWTQVWNDAQEACGIEVLY